MDTNNNWVDFTLKRGSIRGKDRNKVGLVLTVRAQREVEDFMSGLANGRRLPVDAVGEAWYAVGSEETPLEFYAVESQFENKRAYSLDQVGGPLLITQPSPRGIVSSPADDIANLSFLRLAGISGEGGVSIGLVGAYSWDYINRARSAMPMALKQFLHDYLVPITINLQVINKGD
jgi:hypothetical protein